MPWTKEEIQIYRAELVNRGLCENCRQERGCDGTKTKCRSCADIHNDRILKRRHDKQGSPIRNNFSEPWVKGQNCKMCRESFTDGRTTQRCQTCSDIVNQRAVITKQKRHESNICQTCGRHKPITRGQYHLCFSCYLRAAASRHLGSTSRWKELRDLWEKQKGVCPYTGKQLTLGVDASVDHIYPQLRYPELKNDISNIEWIDFKINLMKRDMTKNEFIALLTTIKNHVG